LDERVFRSWCDFSELDAIRSNTLRDLDDGPQREVVGAALPEGKKEGPQCHISATRWIMSALPPKADICSAAALGHARFRLAVSINPTWRTGTSAFVSKAAIRWLEE
jgi:hypothetical protein